MLTLPTAILHILLPFAPLFSNRVWAHAQLLVAGALLTPGRRTVAACLRAVGLGECRQFGRYHRVLSHASWSGLKLSRVLLKLLVETFAPTGTLVFGGDETLERRWGKRIGALGVYYDAVRSTPKQVVKSRGLRWFSMMLLVRLPWAARVWALPVLTLLTYTQRYDQQRGKAHRTLVDFARQTMLVLRRWLPDRKLVFVFDGNYAVLSLLSWAQHLPEPVSVITPLRLDAALYELPSAREPGKKGRKPYKGKRLPSLKGVLADSNTAWTRVEVCWYGDVKRAVELVWGEAVWYHPGEPVVRCRWVLVRDPKQRFPARALLCTDLCVSPAQILEWYVLRWAVEVTYEEARRQLGVETQRQWTELAIQRSTPALFGLYSLVALIAHPLMSAQTPLRAAAWYDKAQPTFSDALAAVRTQLWQNSIICLSADTGYSPIEAWSCG